MQSTTVPVARAAKKVGYSITVLINLVILFVAHNLLDWGWPPFLTEEFAEVLPWITFSLLVTIAANIVYQFRDESPLRNVSEMFVNLVSLAVTARIFVTFPFEFSGYEFDWAIVARVTLILAMVGAGIGAITYLVKAVTASE